jgi:Tol biopolymer transport system component
MIHRGRLWERLGGQVAAPTDLVLAPIGRCTALERREMRGAARGKEMRWSPALLALLLVGLPPGAPAAPEAPGPRRLTFDGRRKQDLAWSPEGARLACSLYHMPGRVGVAIIDPASGETRVLGTDPAEMAPSWSPDGKRLVFVHVTQSGTDGELDLFTMNADGTDRRLLVGGKSFENYPSWSPDGTRLLFTTTRDRTQELYIAAADGTGLRRLTSDPALKQHPCWSPDGKRIAFNSSQDGSFDIYVMQVDGSELRRLTEHPAADTWPCWSPDGKRIAFMSMREGNPEVFVMNADGSEPRNVSRSPGFDDCPSWRPAAAGAAASLTWVSDRAGGLDVFAAVP